ncbi:MAG: COX15/CtaA family protein [Acidobacteria bacterium]|nr:COX15/CtaA family protein [Acidobacteriota bacterium]
MPEAFLRIATRTVAACVFLLLIAGALVTSTQSGLAVPDWPLSYGKVMPPMVGGILYEHGHRLVAAAVSTLVGLELGALLFLLKGRKTVKVLAAVAFAAILLQALLGGLTVLFLLPPAVSSAHAALAEIVFALTAVVALMCSKTWEVLRISSKGEKARGAFRWVVLATAAVYLQIVVGAVMRHTGAGLAIPDFPTSFGGLLPTFEEISRPGVPIHLAHRLGALVVVVLVAFAARALSALPGPIFPTLGASWAGLVCLQAFLGASSIWSAKAVPLTVAHLAVGALCWVIGVLASVALAAGFSDKLARD